MVRSQGYQLAGAPEGAKDRGTMGKVLIEPGSRSEQVFRCQVPVPGATCSGAWTPVRVVHQTTLLLRVC